MTPSQFDPEIHHRRSLRLQGYDYARAGAYFVTIVAFQRECLFGEIMDGEMKLNQYGEIVQKWWAAIRTHFPIVETGAFIIMPNHIHGIILISDDRRGTVPVPINLDNIQNQREKTLQSGGMTLQSGGMTPQSGGMTPPLRRTLGQIIAYFKYQSTKEMNAMDGTGVITKFWQRNYYEHNIRNDREMDNISHYIESNPSKWAEDAENPSESR